MATATTNGNTQNGNGQQSESKNTPAHEIRLGRIKGTVWRNKTELGYRFNTTFSRLYRVEDAWRESNSFGRDDLPVLAKVADLIHTWTFSQSQNGNGQNGQGQGNGSSEQTPF